MKQRRDLCLASASPRRRELLERFGLSFAVVLPNVDESRREGEPPAAYAERLAAQKAESAREAHPSHVILAGDTVVVLRDEVLGKPFDPSEAERMLAALSGTTHEVLTGYRLLDAANGDQVSRCIRTRVIFRRLPPAWLRWYSRLDEARDKAGAYGIQGIGAAMVERIEGSYANVVGFPIESVIWDLLDKGWLEL